MKRLTGIDELGYYFPLDITLNCLKHRGECVDHLGAYEDTGLTLERCMELAKADKDGRLVVLPCKPLDTVYSLFCGEIVEKRIGAITINGYTNPRIWVELYCDFLATQTKRWDLAVGKEFYLTREDAEAALKGDAE